LGEAEDAVVSLDGVLPCVVFPVVVVVAAAAKEDGTRLADLLAPLGALAAVAAIAMRLLKSARMSVRLVPGG
jgi:hypothetical protein